MINTHKSLHLFYPHDPFRVSIHIKISEYMYNYYEMYTQCLFSRIAHLLLTNDMRNAWVILLSGELEAVDTIRLRGNILIGNNSMLV